MIHGGAFTAGDDISVPITDVEYLTKQGFVVVSLEYRLAPQYGFFLALRCVVIPEYLDRLLLQRQV